MEGLDDLLLEVRSQVEKRASPRNAGSPCHAAKNLLGGLTGVFVILQHTPTQIEDAALVPLHEDGKGFLVPLLTGLHELHVVLLSLPGNDAWESSLQDTRKAVRFRDWSERAILLSQVRKRLQKRPGCLYLDTCMFSHMNTIT